MALKRPKGDINALEEGERLYWSPLTSTPGLGANRHLPARFPFLIPNRTSTSLNLTPLNSTHLNSLFDPPRPPFWSLVASPNRPKIGPSRLLTFYLFKKIRFSRNLFETNEIHTFFAARRFRKRPKIRPRRFQDDLHTLLFSSSFSSSILIRLRSDFDLILVPFWASKIGTK